MKTYQRYFRRAIFLMASLCLLATSASAARRVHGIGEATQHNATPLLLNHQVLFEKNPATDLSWSDASLERFPTWAVDALLEWDSGKDTRNNSPVMTTIRQRISDHLFPNPNPGAFVYVLTAPAYVYHRLHEAGIATLPTPLLNYPFFKLLFPSDLTHFGTRFSRSHIPAGMPANWTNRYGVMRGDNGGFHMVHDTGGSWILHVDHSNGLTMRHIPNAPWRETYRGAATQEALDHSRENPRGMAFSGFAPESSLAIPVGTETNWKITRMPLGRLSIWRIAPSSWDAESTTPLLRTQKAIYLISGSVPVVPHVVVQQNRNVSGSLRQVVLHIKGIPTSFAALQNGSKELEFVSLPKPGILSAGDFIGNFSGLSASPQALSAHSLQMNNGTLIASANMAAQSQISLLLKNLDSTRLVVAHILSGVSGEPTPAILLDEIDTADLTNEGSDDLATFSGGTPTARNLDFAGTTMDFLNLSEPILISNPIQTLQNGLTVSFWFRANPLVSGKQIIFNTRDTDGRLKIRTELYRAEGMPLYLRTNLLGNTKAGDVPYVEIEGPYDDGNWHHFAIKITTAPQAATEIFVDGVLRRTISWGAELGQGMASTFSIGNRPSGKASEKFTGELDAFRIHTSPIATAWIERLFLADSRRTDRALTGITTYKNAVPALNVDAPFVIGALPILPQKGQLFSITTSHDAFDITGDNELRLNRAVDADSPVSFDITIKDNKGETLAILPAQIREENLALLKASPWFTDAFRTWEKRLNWSRSSNTILLDYPPGVRANPHIAWLRNTAYCAAGGIFPKKFGAYCNEYVYTLMYEAGITELPFFSRRNSLRRYSCSPPYAQIRVNRFSPLGRNWAVWGNDVTASPTPGDVIALVYMRGADYSRSDLGTYHTTFFSHRSKDGRHTWTLGGNQSAWTQFKAYPTDTVASTFIRRSSEMEREKSVASQNGTLHYFWNPGDTITISETGSWEIQPIDLSDTNLVKNLDYPIEKLKGTFFRVVPVGTPEHAAAPTTSRVHYIMKEYTQQRDPILEAVSGGYRIR
ncbi:MAG: LamG domain-containing protein [Desulfobacterales bacterium]|nr:LamG domain-containing protein [Desulfobacterales bacterium]